MPVADLFPNYLKLGIFTSISTFFLSKIKYNSKYSSEIFDSNDKQTTIESIVTHTFLNRRTNKYKNCMVIKNNMLESFSIHNKQSKTSFVCEVQ